MFVQSVRLFQVLTKYIHTVIKDITFAINNSLIVLILLQKSQQSSNSIRIYQIYLKFDNLPKISGLGRKEVPFGAKNYFDA